MKPQSTAAFAALPFTGGLEPFMAHGQYGGLDASVIRCGTNPRARVFAKGSMSR